MKKIILIIVMVVVILGGGAYYYFWYESSKEGVVTYDINPVELLVFEVGNENLSEYQIDRNFKRFTNAKNTINNLLESGEAWESNQLFYSWLDVASVLKILGRVKKIQLSF